MLAFREAIYSHTGVNSTGIYALILCNRSSIPCAVVMDKKKTNFPTSVLLHLVFRFLGGGRVFVCTLCLLTSLFFAGLLDPHD